MTETMAPPVCVLNWPMANVPGYFEHAHWTPCHPQDPSLQYAQPMMPHYVEYFLPLKITQLEDLLRYGLECQVQALQEQLCRANMEKAKLQEENATQRRDRALQNTHILVQQDCMQKLEKQLQDERLKAERQRLELEETQRSIALRAAESEKEVQRLRQEKTDYEERLEVMERQLEGLLKEKEKETEEAEKQRTEAEEHSRGLAQKVAESEKEVGRLQQENGDSEQRLAKLQKHVEALKQDKLEQQKKLEEALSSLISLRTLVEEAWHKDLQRSSQGLFALEQRLEDAQGCIKLLLEAPVGREEELQPEGPFAPETPRELKEATQVDFDAPKAGDQEPAKQRPSLGGRSHDSQGSTRAPEDGEDSRPDSFDIDDLEEQLQHAEAPSGHEEDLPAQEVSGQEEVLQLEESQSSPQGVASPSSSQCSTDCPTSPNPSSSSDSLCDRSLSSGYISEEERWQTWQKHVQEGSDHQQSQRLHHAFDDATPDEILTVLLNFLPVAEVVRATRAVSRFFSDSKVWIAHLFKLMDVESVLEHSGKGLHPVEEFLTFESVLYHRGLEGAMEIASNASEGFQGYRLWLRGHVKWHAHNAEKSSHFMQLVMEWYCRDKFIRKRHIGREMCRILLVAGISDLRLDIANGLLPVLSENRLSLDICQLALLHLDSCQIAFPFLSKSFVAQLVDLAVGWMGQHCNSWKNLENACWSQVIHILDAILPVDEAHCAIRCLNAMILAHKHGKSREFLVKKRELKYLLSG